MTKTILNTNKTLKNDQCAFSFPKKKNAEAFRTNFHSRPISTSDADVAPQHTFFRLLKTLFTSQLLFLF